MTEKEVRTAEEARATTMIEEANAKRQQGTTSLEEKLEYTAAARRQKRKEKSQEPTATKLTTTRLRPAIRTLAKADTAAMTIEEQDHPEKQATAEGEEKRCRSCLGTRRAGTSRQRTF